MVLFHHFAFDHDGFATATATAVTAAGFAATAVTAAALAATARGGSRFAAARGGSRFAARASRFAAAAAGAPASEQAMAGLAATAGRRGFTARRSRSRFAAVSCRSRFAAIGSGFATATTRFLGRMQASHQAAATTIRTPAAATTVVPSDSRIIRDSCQADDGRQDRHAENHRTIHETNPSRDGEKPRRDGTIAKLLSAAPPRHNLL
jgi:hypothetical protein